MAKSSLVSYNIIFEMLQKSFPNVQLFSANQLKSLMFLKVARARARARHSSGIHFFIFLLKISRDSESFMSFGNMSHIFGAKKETLSVPYLTEFTLRLVKTLFPRKL